MSRQTWEKADTAAARQTHWNRQTDRQTAPEQTGMGEDRHSIRQADTLEQTNRQTDGTGAETLDQA